MSATAVYDDEVILDKYNGRATVILTSREDDITLHWMLLGHYEPLNVWLTVPLSWAEADHLVRTIEGKTAEDALAQLGEGRQFRVGFDAYDESGEHFEFFTTRISRRSTPESVGMVASAMRELLEYLQSIAKSRTETPQSRAALEAAPVLAAAL